MKKLLLIIFMGMFTVGIQAQTINRVPLSTTNSTNLDTIPNAGTRKQVVTAGNSTNLRIQANVVKLTGTAGGNVTLLGSLDGINFEPIPSLKSDGTIGMDTLKITNVSTLQTHSFIVPVIYHNKYQISYTGAGTMSATLSTFESEKLSPVYFKP